MQAGQGWPWSASSERPGLDPDPLGRTLRPQAAEVQPELAGGGQRAAATRGTPRAARARRRSPAGWRRGTPARTASRAAPPAARRLSPALVPLARPLRRRAPARRATRTRCRAPRPAATRRQGREWRLDVVHDTAFVSLVGLGLGAAEAARAERALEKAGVPLVALRVTPSALVFRVANPQASDAVRALHAAFLE